MNKAKTDTEVQLEALPVPGLVPVAQGFPGHAPARIVKFRDTLYTSRTVVLPDGRTLAVARGEVTVDIADDVALKCLKAHPEFEQLKE